MKQREAGFTLVEVVVAFAIVALVLGGLYHLMADALRGETRAKVNEQALALASAHLEAIGIDRALEPGDTTGVYATGLAWRLTIEPIETLSYRGQAFRIVLEPLDRSGKPLLRLETFKLVSRTNRGEGGGPQPR
jgi:general secretion pathway protein I